MLSLEEKKTITAKAERIIKPYRVRKKCGALERDHEVLVNGIIRHNLLFKTENSICHRKKKHTSSICSPALATHSRTRSEKESWSIDNNRRPFRLLP